VAEVTWISWFGAYYQGRKTSFSPSPSTPTLFQSAQGEFIVSDGQMQAYRNTRTARLVMTR